MQSVAVKLIVEKEREIQNFKPVESWKIGVEMHYKGSSFKAQFSKVDGKIKKLASEQDVQKVLATLIDDIKTLKEGETKREGKTLLSTENFDFKLTDADKKDSKRSP